MGAYVRNRRLRVSTRKIDQNPSAISDKFDANLATKFALKNFDCVTQSITYLAAAKVDLLEINDYKKYEPFLLLAQEAGAFVKKSEQKITLTNQVLHDSL